MLAHRLQEVIMNKKFKVISLFLIIVLAFSIVGCTGDVEAPTGSEEAGDSNGKPLKVALLLSGPISDQGWNASAYNGLVAIEEQFGADISYTESVAQSDIEEVLRNYAIQGYDIIFGHGFEFVDGIMAVHADFPDNIFMLTSSTVFAEPNVGSVTDNGMMKGFLGGVVAATISETNTVAFLGGAEIPPIVDGRDGFIAGAKYINPDIDVRTTLTGNFDNAGQAKETAIALIGNGVDIMMVQADMAGLGAIEAAEDAGTYIIGVNTDQNKLAPNTVITSALANYSIAMVLMVERVIDGQWEPAPAILGVKEGMVDLAPYYGLENELTDEAKETIADARQAIIDGDIDPIALVEALK